MRRSSTQVEVSVTELRAGLSRYLRDVADGAVITVTHRGRPVGRLVGMDEPDHRLATTIASALQPARTHIRYLPERIAATGTVSDLVAEQRR